jgi:hypothetical protein
VEQDVFDYWYTMVYFLLVIGTIIFLVVGIGYLNNLLPLVISQRHEIRMHPKRLRNRVLLYLVRWEDLMIKSLDYDEQDEDLNFIIGYKRNGNHRL